jgi:hypothetical protein
MASADIFGSVALGDIASAPGSSGAMRPGLLRPYLLGSLGSAPLSINWRRVENEAESVCSRVVTTERLLHEALGSIHHNILHLVQVSLWKEAKIQPVFQ